MFWRATTSTHNYEYHAVVKIEDRTSGTALYGQRRVKLTLANGQTQELTLEHSEWASLNSSVFVGGLIINP